jgi:hypothetical protein
MSRSPQAHFETFGFAVLPSFIDPAVLSAELDAALHDAFADPDHVNTGTAGNEFRYVPTMCERTPVSLALVVRLSAVASELLGAPVLPVRAKATSYHGSTTWHRDTELPVRSVGFALYLEALDAGSGALRVIPGSHRPELAAAIERYAAGASLPAEDLPGVAVATTPGDVIAFDERLYHASAGGARRRQWRVDFVADVPGADAVLRDYFGGTFAPGWDGGYDVDRFPSYGAHWRTLDARWNERLDALGAYGAASTEEDFVRARRRSARG